MATDPKIKYDISANVEGGDDVEALATRVEELGAALGGDFKTKADAAAAALRDLGDKQEAAQNFFELKQRSDDAARSLEQAQKAAQAMGQEMAQTEKPTKSQERAFNNLRDSVARANTEYLETRQALGAARGQLTEYGLSVTGLSVKQGELRTKIAEARTEASQLGASMASAGSGTEQAAESTSRFGSAMESLRERLSSASSRLQDFTVGSALGGAVLGFLQGAISSVRQMGAAFVRANDDLDTLRGGLRGLYGNAETAEEQIRHLRQTASAAGQSFDSLGQSWTRFTASMTQANIPLDRQRELFDAVVLSGEAMGRTTNQNARVLQQLARMADEGDVSLSRLEKRLGRDLPGALKLTADGMGVTELELRDLLKSGTVMAEEVIPALTKSLQENAQANTGSASVWQRLKDAVAQTMTTMGDSGGVQVMTLAMRALAETVRLILVPLAALVATVQTLAQGVGALAASIATLAMGGGTLAERFGRAGEVMRAFGQDVSGNAARVAELDAAFAAAVGNSEALSAAMRDGTEATDESSESLARLGAQYQAVREEVEQGIELAEKELTATKARAGAMVEQAKLLGDEGALRQAVGRAAEMQAEALEAVAERKQDELIALQQELIAKQAVYEQDGKISERRQRELDDLQKLIAVKEVDVDRSVGQVRAAQAVAKAKGEEAQATAAGVEAARASALAKSSDAESSVGLLQIQRNLASQTERLARVTGNETKIREARNEQARLGVEIMRAQANAMRVEAEGAIAVAEATRAQLQVTGELTAVKEAELEATIRSAQIKVAQSEAVQEAADIESKIVARLAEEWRNAKGARDNYYSDAAGDTEDATDSVGDAHERMGDKISGTWVSASVASSQYAEDAKRHAWEIFEEQRQLNYELQLALGQQSRQAAIGAQKIIKDLTVNAEEYIEIMQRIDDQQRAVLGSQSEAAQGVAELEMRLLELNGTEEDIAKARKARQAEEIQQKIELQKLELERAAVSQDHEAAQAAQEEIALLNQQLELLRQIDRAEQSRAQQKRQERTESRAERDPTQSTGRDTQRGGVQQPTVTGGNQYVSNITLGEKQTQIRTADRESQQELEGLLRRLADARGTAL